MCKEKSVITAARRLVKLYGRNLIAVNEDLEEVGKELNNCIPAVIREVVERSKLGAISRTRGEGEIQISAADLTVAARGMKNHLQLMMPTSDEPSVEQKLGNAFTGVVEKVLSNSNGAESVYERLERLQADTSYVKRRMS
jgi:hypothetical protein